MVHLAKSAVAILAAVYSVRMFSLFMVWPVLALHSSEYQDTTVILTGVALGIHGLTQALLQIPLGALSDYIGRKAVIIGGLVLFFIGSLIAASADSIYQVIIGRALQGAGAISSALTAFVADLTSDAQRSKVMAIIGLGIGASFVLALVLAPPIHGYISLSGMFAVTAVLAVIAMGLIAILPSITIENRQVPDIRKAFASPELVRFYGGVFCLHLVMAANFMLLPPMLNTQLPVSSEDHWIFYLPILLVSFLLVFPLLAFGEKRASVKHFFLLSIALAIAGQLIWPMSDNLWWLSIGVLVFFIGFNYLEANLPSLVTRYCDPNIRGSAMGVYSSMQFAGVFVGASGAGIVIEHWGASTLSLFTAAVLVLWFVFAFSMKKVVSKAR